jgi:hypothetical protein
MPYVDGKDLTPDEAMEANRCPECGVDLTKVNPIAELNSHWTKEPPNNRSGDEGRRRREMLREFITKNKVRTSDQPKPAAPNAAPVA